MRGDLQRLTGLAPCALRDARKTGLRTVKVGQRRFISGRDWHEYLSRLETVSQ